MHKIAREAMTLYEVLESCGPGAVAVSGGVDSMTLAYVAHLTLGTRVTMFHAVSPAVPPSATERIRRYAQAEGWQLELLNAGEFGDERYLHNPVNRCFFCKSNLYGTLAQATPAQLMSGTNLDDLGDWRPGLQAAEHHAVRHPFVEAGLAKSDVRALAREHGLTDLAELPSAPCLSSRVETGLWIDAETLQFVDRTEEYLRAKLAPETVRCRVRKDGIVIELDPGSLGRLDEDALDSLSLEIERQSPTGTKGRVTFSSYSRGSAFLRDEQHD